MKRMLFMIMMALMVGACAQPQGKLLCKDSVAFVNVEWEVDTLDGFLLKQYQFQQQEIFGSNQHISIIEIPATSPRQLAFAYDTVLTETSILAEKKGALAAVNGSFFDMDKGNPICYLRIDSVEVGENTPGKKDTVNRKYYQYGTLVLDNGYPKIIETDSNRYWEENLGYRDVMTAGPLLIHHKMAMPMRDDRTFVTKRHNRTAIGIKADSTVVIMTVDGRCKEKYAGLSLIELIEMMRWIGCVEALNMDGGGSTTMYIKGKENAGIVNYPSDYNKFSYEGQPPVSNIIYLL